MLFIVTIVTSQRPLIEILRAENRMLDVSLQGCRLGPNFKNSVSFYLVFETPSISKDSYGEACLFLLFLLILLLKWIAKY